MEVRVLSWAPSYRFTPSHKFPKPFTNRANKRFFVSNGSKPSPLHPVYRRDTLRGDAGICPYPVQKNKAQRLPTRMNATTPRKSTPLTATKIRQAKAHDFPLWDGDGLHLILTASGSRMWRLKYYRPDGRENRLALGRSPEVWLAEMPAAPATTRASNFVTVATRRSNARPSRTPRTPHYAIDFRGCRRALDRSQTQGMGSRDIAQGAIRLCHIPCANVICCNTNPLPR